MSVKNFIPTLWSARLLANLDKAHVFANIVNRDYEGEIKQLGDSVKINQMGNVTIGDYTGADIADAEDLTSTQKELKIDQAKYFNFQVDDIDKAQANVTLMDKGMQRASYALSEEVDKAIAEKYVEAGSQIGTDELPVALTAENVYDQMVDLGVALDEKNVGRQGRFVVVPAFVHGLLQKSDAFVSANNEVAQNGLVGKVAGFEVYVSNNVAKVGDNYKIMAGTPEAITFAEQILEVEAYRPEKRFSDAIKGLHVYGIAVTQPDALAVLTATRG